MITPPLRIDTERLTLRKPSMEDAETLFGAYTQDPDVAKYTTWRPHKELPETEDYLRRCLRGWETGDGFTYAIVLKDGGELVGMIDIRPRGFKADTGYVLATRHWGQGYAAEALRALIEWAFSQGKIYRVWAVCDVENKASARVLEKAGMTLEGRLRRNMMHPNVSEEPRDTFCYSIVR